MLETAIVLIVGFGLGYGVREWLSRRRHRVKRHRRQLYNSLGHDARGASPAPAHSRRAEAVAPMLLPILPPDLAESAC